MAFGYIQEIFSSFQGEGAAVSGSCYGLRQIFIRFAGCPLALGAHGTNGCVWCDSAQAKSKEIKYAKIETEAGSQQFEILKNPLTVPMIMNALKRIKTYDLHSVSLTGGEPLFQQDFLAELLISLKKENYKTYLETAWTDQMQFLHEISNYIDYACVDIKDRTAKASNRWEKLVEEEISMCEILLDNKVKVFAKVVITKHSKDSDFEYISKKCGDIGVPLVIQPVTPIKSVKVEKPTWAQIRKFSEIAGKYLPPEKIGLSIQMHKLMNIL